MHVRQRSIHSSCAAPLRCNHLRALRLLNNRGQSFASVRMSTSTSASASAGRFGSVGLGCVAAGCGVGGALWLNAQADAKEIKDIEDDAQTTFTAGLKMLCNRFGIMSLGKAYCVEEAKEKDAKNDAEKEGKPSPSLTREWTFYSGKKGMEGCEDLLLFTGSANPELAQEIAHYLNLKDGNIIAHQDVGKYNDGEVSCKINVSVREKDVFIVQVRLCKKKWTL